MASGGNVNSTSGGLAGRYAAALYAQASELNTLDATVTEMESLGSLIAQSADMRRLLGSPLVDVLTAQKATSAVLESHGFSQLLRNFVGVVVQNRRMRALSDIIVAFAALVAEKRGVVVAQVDSAFPLSDTQEQALRARLIEAGFGNVNIVKRVDPALLGGLVVKIGARLFDSSLKSRLQRLQYAMKGAA